MNIYEKLLTIIEGVERLPKTAYNEKDKYNYVPEALVTEYLRKKLCENKLVMIWNNVRTEFVGDNKVKATMKYEIFDVETKEKINGEWRGEGVSVQGYATSIAITTAIKQAQMKLFMIPTEDAEQITGSSPQPKDTPPEEKPSVEIPSIVPAEISAVPEEPGTKRRVRSPKKAVNKIVEEIPEKPAEAPQVSESALGGYYPEAVETKPDTVVSDSPEQPEGASAELPDSDPRIPGQQVSKEQFILGVQNALIEIVSREEYAAIQEEKNMFYCVDEQGNIEFARLK